MNSANNWSEKVLFEPFRRTKRCLHSIGTEI